jgi:propionyl-CoA synthetase
MTTLYNNTDRFKEAYLAEFPGYYSAGDAGLSDEEGYIHILERTDDAINVAGHRISTGLLEEAVLSHHRVPECAVIGANDDLKGVVPVCLFVSTGSPSSAELEQISKEIIATVREKVGAVAAMRTALPVDALPKTRSGKILRNVIRKIANGEEYKLPGTIEDASVVDKIVGVLRKD